MDGGDGNEVVDDAEKEKDDDYVTFSYGNSSNLEVKVLKTH